MLHPPVSRVSSACCEITSPSRPAPSSADCIIAPPSTGFPSSVKPNPPAAASASYFVSRSPMLPTVAAGIANSRTLAPRPGEVIHSSDSTVSFTGTVFGIATTVVYPPAAAAAVPVAIVSL